MSTQTYYRDFTSPHHQSRRWKQISLDPTKLQDLERKQEVLFEELRIAGSSGNEKISGIDLLIKTLVREGATGNSRSNKEIERYQNLRKQSAEREVYSETRLAIAESRKRAEKNNEFVTAFDSFIALVTLPAFYKEFEKVHGVKDSFDFIPEHFKLAALPESIERVANIIRKHAKPRQSGVGYKSPPKETRFKKGTSGNLKGRPRKPTVWESLDANLQEEVTVLKSGKQSKQTKLRCSLEQVMQNAIRGDAGARRQIRLWVQELDGAGMFSPPTPTPRRRRRKVSEDLTFVHRLFIRERAKQWKQHLWEKFTEHYGPVPEFETVFERIFSDLEGDEAFKKLEAIKERLAERQRESMQ